jgi:hypothetical protein
MPLDRHRQDRLRRTEAVIEILRRRAAQRDARGEAVPPALRAAIADFDNQLDHGGARADHPRRSDPR